MIKTVVSYIICLALLATLAACHKKQPAAPSPAAESSATRESAAGGAAPTPAQPLPPPPKSVTANADNNVQQKVDGEVDPFLTGQLRAFVEKNHRVPASFYEFSVRTLDSMPRPPEGKKWAIDASDVTVKAVAK